MSIQATDDAIRDRYRRAAATAANTSKAISFGAGDLLRFADIQAGETVLDLGCGTGFDAVQAAEAAGPAGRVIGIDMLPEMCAQARKNTAGYGNVTIREADMAALPLPAACVDLVISNCVINLAPDKARVIREARRVLAPGGRLVVVDTAFDAEPDSGVRTDLTAWSCCVAGALTVETYRQMVAAAGFDDVAVTDLGPFDASSVSDADVRSVLVTATRAGLVPVELRPAVADDLDAVAGLLAAEGLPLEGFDIDSAAVAVGTATGSVEGAVMLEQFSGGSSFLRSLVVAPAVRKQGVGRLLARAAVEMSVALGSTDTYLLTADAGDFFARLGFTVVDASVAQEACPSTEFGEGCCSGALAMRLHHEQDTSASCCPPG